MAGFVGLRLATTRPAYIPIGSDRSGVRLDTDRVHLASELADGSVGQLGDGGRVAVEKPELLVGDEQWHHRGLGIRRPRTLSEARWLQEGSRIGGCKVYRPPLGARPGGGGGRAETEGVIGEVERWCGTRSGESRDSKGTGPRIQFGN